jgi:uncharacterized protein (TIGR04376 family)
MGLFNDVSTFLEERLEEFLRNNPHLELQALEEQLQSQESDAISLVADLQRQEKQLKDDVLGTAKEVQTWHLRIEKAIAANRPDLVKPAQEREATLLRQGNHLWGQMKGVQERSLKTKELVSQIQARQKEIRAKIEEARTKTQTKPNKPGKRPVGAPTPPPNAPRVPTISMMPSVAGKWKRNWSNSSARLASRQASARTRRDQTRALQS